ncbi:MAG: nuclear transport factor 2 family protein [Gemmatimonadaceae bacterium]
MLSAFAPLLFAWAVACVSGAGMRTAPDAASEVRAARGQWNRALLGQDSSALAALVEDSAVHVSPQFTHVGKPAYLALFLRNMMRRPEFRLTYEPDRVTACERVECPIVTEYGRWRETWLQDGEPTEVSGTYFAIWRKHGDRWQVRSESFATQACRGRRYCAG